MTFEEGTSAAWLYDLLRPHSAKKSRPEIGRLSIYLRCYFHSQPFVWVFPSASTSNSKGWATVLSRANFGAAEL